MVFFRGENNQFLRIKKGRFYCPNSMILGK